MTLILCVLILSAWTSSLVCTFLFHFKNCLGIKLRTALLLLTITAYPTYLVGVHLYDVTTAMRLANEAKASSCEGLWAAKPGEGLKCHQMQR